MIETIELDITVTPEMQKLIDQRLSEGRYIDAADYLRDLLRHDLVKNGNAGRSTCEG